MGITREKLDNVVCDTYNVCYDDFCCIDTGTVCNFTAYWNVEFSSKSYFNNKHGYKASGVV